MLVAELEFGTIIWIVVLLVVPIAAIAFAGAGKALAQIGKGDLSIEQELPSPRRGPPPPVSDAVRNEEIRQMLQAKSDRRVARGEAPLDIEDELAKLAEIDPVSTPALRQDAALREEVRQLVIARNERRMRQGQEPLDVEAEIDRQLRDAGA